jgi:hypothetical protein
MYIGFKTFFYVVRHLDSIASYLHYYYYYRPMSKKSRFFSADFPASPRCKISRKSSSEIRADTCRQTEGHDKGFRDYANVPIKGPKEFQQFLQSFVYPFGITVEARLRSFLET